jgi:hypothetical protein
MATTAACYHRKYHSTDFTTNKIAGLFSALSMGAACCNATPTLIQ